MPTLLIMLLIHKGYCNVLVPAQSIFRFYLFLLVAHLAHLS